jgi:hypothetical protein
MALRTLTDLNLLSVLSGFSGSIPSAPKGVHSKLLATTPSPPVARRIELRAS